MSTDQLRFKYADHTEQWSELYDLTVVKLKQHARNTAGPQLSRWRFLRARCVFDVVGAVPWSTANDERAVEFLLQAANDEHATTLTRAGAHNWLGYCYDYRRGVDTPSNTALCDARALAHFKAASQLDFADAQCTVACCYFKGTYGVTKNVDTALALYAKAAAQEHPVAITSLAMAYDPMIDDDGVPSHIKDTAKCIEYYKRAMALGNAEAMHMYALLIDPGVAAVTKSNEADVRQAFKLYAESAALGFAESYNCLGVCYDKGRGVHMNKKLAFENYRLGAEKKNAMSMVNLGVCYEGGDHAYGLSKADHKRAYELYVEASADKYECGQANYFAGWCLEKGIGTRENAAEAATYYARARRFGYTHVHEK